MVRDTVPLGWPSATSGAHADKTSSYWLQGYSLCGVSSWYTVVGMEFEIDFTTLDDEAATSLVGRLVKQLRQARTDVERAERRVSGIRKLIDAVVEMYPAAEDELPEDLDDDEEPRPRGAEAVRRVLDENAGKWHGVSDVVSMLEARDWLPDSSNPANAVRTALQRLSDRKVIEKGKGKRDGAIAYRIPAPPPAPPRYDPSEEPF